MNRTARTLGIAIPVALLAVAMPIDAMAQRARRGQGRGSRAFAEGEAKGEKGERMVEALGLTEEQQAAVCDIRAAAAEQRKAVFKKYEGQVRENREAIGDELKAIGESTHDALAGILTAEQLEKVEKTGKRRRERLGGRGGQGAGGRGRGRGASAD